MKTNQLQIHPGSAARPDGDECVDVHCHCLFGMDDGPQTMADSLTLCRALVADGITTAIATPHQLGRYDGRNTASDIRLAVSQLNDAVLHEGLPIKIVPGAEVRIDERLVRLLDQHQVMTMADAGRYLILELPNENCIGLRTVWQELAKLGISVILPHPERSEWLCRNLEAILPCVEQGMILQITAGSLIGDYGPRAELISWKLLAMGAVSLVASDAHDVRNRPPRMSQARTAISSELGPGFAWRVCVENPLKVLKHMQVNLPADSEASCKYDRCTKP